MQSHGHASVAYKIPRDCRLKDEDVHRNVLGMVLPSRQPAQHLRSRAWRMSAPTMVPVIAKACGSVEPYCGRVRYLAESFILGALRRGRSVEQFLGPCGSAERPAVRYAEIRATSGPFEVYLHTVEDVGSEGFWDLGEFPPFDPDDEAAEFGLLLGMAEDPLAALQVAEQRAGAERGRWVNEGVVQDEYGDFVRAGRLSSPTADGRRWPNEPDAVRPCS